MARSDELAACSEEGERITRPFGSPSMQKAQELVGHWILEAGMRVSRDNVGNVLGRYEATDPGRPTLLMGSHLDTVRGAGKYDGMLGVLVAIAAVQALHDSGHTLPFSIDVIAFADEEGLRFGSTYLGSRALAGTLSPADLNVIDARGISLSQAITDFGGDPTRIETCAHILERAQDVGAQRNVTVTVKAVSENAAVPCSPRLSQLLSRAVEDARLEVLHLSSGAGHDGVAISSLPEIGMLFVRCKGGVSHSPAESVTAEDVQVAIDVLGHFLERLAAA